jgi:hypothetical protein
MQEYTKWPKEKAAALGLALPEVTQVAPRRLLVGGHLQFITVTAVHGHK